MQYNPEEFNEILNIYKAESEELLQGLNDNFLELENNPQDKTPIKKLLQLSHSLKGSSRMIGFNSIQDISHKLEDILSYWKKEDAVINPDAFQVIYQVCDYLGELVDKSVKQKSEYFDSNTVLIINKLENILNSANEPKPEEKQQNLNDNYIIDKNIDINAILLELMFVLEKENLNEDDLEEVFLVILENLKQLAEIFSNTDLKDIKEEIAYILTETSAENFDKAKFSLYRQKIRELRDDVYKLYKDLNISSNANKQIVKQEKQKIIPNVENTVDEKNNTQADLNKDFDYILSNLQKIKYEKIFIKKINEILKNIIEKTNEERIIMILSKTLRILKIFDEKDVIIDNDCYMVILQCIYLAKRISSNEKEENPNNLNFLIQRLNVVENMLEITNTNTSTNIQVVEKESILSPDDCSNIRKNIESYDIQTIKTLRVDTAKLDTLISQTGELLINGIKTREHINELSRINNKLIQWNTASKKIINYLKYLEKKGFFNSIADDSAGAFYKKAQTFFVDNADLINELNNDFSNLYNMISEDDNKLHQTAMEIETIAKGIRVLPLATLFHSFPRMIRDIAKEHNKKIDFIVSGSDTTVDKKIIEEIKMPLIHILRNAVSHGIETAEDRKKNNKAANGIIKLTAKQIENNIVITIEDDGYGINLEKVKNVALQKGLLSQEEITNLNNEQLMKLLFFPGFSTQEAVDEISGRGVGLDVVKTKITNLNGDITIDSVLNKGCKVTIKLPLSMSTLKAFILLINQQKYAIPVNTIKFVKQIKNDEIFHKNGVDCIIHEEHSIPIYFLSEILGETNNKKDENYLMVIIIGNNERQAAYVVDRLLGDQEVFQKKLVPPILKIKNISGFTTLSTGEICLILNPYELMRNTIINNHIPMITTQQLYEM